MLPRRSGSVVNISSIRGFSPNPGRMTYCAPKAAVIMMTSVATVAGHFPLTLVTGAGAAARNSIGLVLVGGMTIGTIFTLFIVPSLYMLIAKEHHEKSLMEPDLEGVTEDVDLTPEYASALATDGNGNGWKKG